MFKQIFFLVFIFAFSCKKESPKEQKVIEKKSKISHVIHHKKATQLNDFSLSNIQVWKEYNEVATLLKLFENTSPDQGLNNAIELKKLVKNLKDSIRIAEFKTPAFKTRINVLENETLRLADMTYIPAITSGEVNEQIAKIFLVFGSLNAKINTFYNQKQLDTDDFFRLDSLDLRKVNPIESIKLQKE